MHGQQHPDLEQLDRLRAGLLDDQPQSKAVLQQHVTGCAVCRDRSNWQSLRPGALGPDLDSAALRQSLRAARSQALQAPGGRHAPHGFLPYATAALLLLAVSIGIWTLQTGPDVPPQMAARDVERIPDVYEDLEFYLWLANQKENGNGDENGNPNNT